MAVSKIPAPLRSEYVDVTAITNGTGHVRYTKKSGVVTMGVDITPSDASSLISWAIPPGCFPRTHTYHSWTDNGCNCYMYFYPDVADCKLNHNGSVREIMTTISYVAAP